MPMKLCSLLSGRDHVCLLSMHSTARCRAACLPVSRVHTQPTCQCNYPRSTAHQKPDASAYSNTQHVVYYTLADGQGHDKVGHPESSSRVAAIQQAILQQERQQKCQWRQLRSQRLATDEDLQLVHPAQYIQRLQQLCDGLEEPTMLDDSTYLAPGSMQAARQAVGCTLDLVDQLLTSGAEGSMGFALVRPPGHHVLPTRPMGFGAINTVSVATRYAQTKHAIGRCLIFDFDVHNGNGSMEVFYEDPSVLYISTHQAGLWPYTGKVNTIGSGPGKGYTLNIPLPAGSGDRAIHNVLEKVVCPAARRFQPDMIIVSAGYDAHWQDPLASLQLQTSTYGYLGHQLARLACELCAGRLLLVLEGGYQLQVLGDCVLATFDGLIQGQDFTHGYCDLYGNPPNTLVQDEPLNKVNKLLEQVRSLHHLT